jgi:DNA-binding CsgD family transcriptional regulator
VYGEAAADRALEAGDDRAAILLLLDLVGHSEHPPTRRISIAQRLAEAATWGVAGLGELGDRVVAALHTVLDTVLGSSAQVAEIRLQLGRLLLQLGEFDAAAEQTELALPGLAERPALAARAMMSLAWPRGRGWPADRHAAWLGRADELLPHIRDPADHAVLAVDQASVRLMLGRDEGWDAHRRLPATTLFERRQLARLLLNTGHVAVAWGRDAAARERLEAAERLMAETGYRRLLNSVRLTTAYLDWLAGRWHGLAARVRVLADADETLPEARLEARGTLALLELVSGDRNRARAELSAVLEDLVRRGVTDGEFAPAAALAHLDLADGQLESALAVTAAGMDTVVRKRMWRFAGSLVVVRIGALVQAGRLAEAESLVRRLAAEVPAEADAPAAHAALALAHGIVADARADHDQAATRFAEAAHRYAEVPRPYQELLALERHCRAQLGAGHADCALGRLEDVQRRLRELGAGWDADRVARLLRAHGVEVARTWRGGRRGYGDQLSPREDQVARLVAQGLTNRQVAEQLFLSPRTVDRHLSGAMRKLGVTSRTALAIAVRDGSPAEIG